MVSLEHRILLLIAALFAAPPAQAQFQARPGFFGAELRIFLVARMAPLLDRSPDQLSREAFSSEYGRAVVQDVAVVLLASADPVCLQSKRIGRDLVPSVDKLLVDYGATILSKHRNAADPRKFEDSFTGSVGASWKAEISALRQDANVRKYLQLREPLVLASVVEDTTEILDRYVRLEHIKLSGTLYPLMSRSEHVKQTVPYDTAGKAVSEFLKANGSPQIERWNQLEIAASQAWLDSVSDDALRALTQPQKLVPDFRVRLQEFCVSR